MKNDKKLKIGVFCSVEFSTPPSMRMKDIHAPLWLTYFVTNELVRRGHNVTLFASSDSKTNAKLVSDGIISIARNKRLSHIYKQVIEIKKENFLEEMIHRREINQFYEFLAAVKLVKATMETKFDILWIEGKKILPFAALSPVDSVFVINGPVDESRIYLREYKKRYHQIHFVAISNSQRKSAPDLFSDVVYHGIKIEKFPFNPKPKDFLLYCGRILPKKGVHIAIKVAKRVKKKLVIVGRHTEDSYWRKEIKSKLKEKIEYKGFVPYPEIPSVYKNAKALLFPILWEEPFGLVMIEAMACGTPVIAFRRGSVPEVVKDGKTGYIVEPYTKDGKVNIDGFVEAVKNIDKIKREDCRKWVEENFTVEKMVENYEKVFLKILKKKIK